MILSLGGRCCCGCRSLAVLVMLSLGNLELASAVYCRLFTVLVLSTAAAAVFASAVYCRSFAVLVLSTAADVSLLSLSW
ncbi:hypothetical protein MAM1_0332c09773 [Mucor ambiguus]|uniref:Uncharacterized protein n=1 Tax=Mucor ambiguus TaxID=91626 RepID=A0A0C9LXN0_9FUNG|nr:hypothetical protein MAM1_0332c09773 [Mucor ambiguus]